MGSSTPAQLQQLADAIVKIVKSYNVLTNHMTTFFKKNSASQKEHEEIKSKFNELLPEIIEIQEDTNSRKLKGYEDVRKIADNIFNRDYRPISLSLHSDSQLNNLFNILRSLFNNKNITMEDCMMN